MKHRTEDYGAALAEVILERQGKEEKKVMDNFLALVRRNGDAAHLPKILDHADRLIRAKTGRRKVVLETARPLSPAARRMLDKTLKPDDAVEERISPALIAGVRLTVNEELQWDGSLAKKISRLFAETQ